MTVTLPPQLCDASASQKLVWVVLCESGPLTVPEIAEKIQFTESGVYDIVADLQRKSAVEKQPLPHDPCRNVYCASRHTDTM